MPVLRNIAQLATCPPDSAQHDAGLIPNAAVVIRDGTVQWVGRHRDLPAEYRGEAVTDCNQGLVIPGLIDCHTHLCFGGWRGDEFEQRIRGASYQDIAAAGGGIVSTVAATRSATTGELLRKARTSLDAMLDLGVTTVECKTGYGLDEANEMKQLDVYRQLDRLHPVDLVVTFLGAHVVPPDRNIDRGQWVRTICDTLIPRIGKEGLAQFCDAFVEKGAYTIEEADRIFSAARQHGLGIKVHADQLSDGGGARLAARHGATSAEHLEYISDEGITALAEKHVVAVSLPLASLYLDEAWIPARRLIEAGVKVAVATDFNPGSAPSYHLPLAMTLACLKQKMTPSEALQGATSIAARALNLQGKTGSLLPGYRADLAVIDAPSVNHWLYHFQPNACRAVMKNGRWISP